MTSNPPTGSLSTRLSEVLARTPWPAHSATVSLALDASSLPFHGLPELDGDWFYWARPSEERYLLGLGAIGYIEATGAERFTILRHALRASQDTHQPLDPEATGTKPKWFAAIAFDAFDTMGDCWSGLPNSGLYLPELLLERSAAGSHLIFTTHATAPDQARKRWLELAAILEKKTQAPAARSGRRTPLQRISEQPASARWLNLVEEAIEAISGGAADKIVPVRSIRVKAERRLSPSRLMAVLDCLYPSCQLLGMSRNGRTLVAATPECLVRLDNGQLSSDAIAGTADRAAADEADERLGQQLLSDPKSQREQALVVEAIGTALENAGITVDLPGKPRLLRLRGLQHLQTRIQARLEPGSRHILDLAQCLHPTPAVNGYPAEAALEWLRTHEHLQRGWFSGCGGWIDSDGEGELDVLLRCALLDGDQAQLFAGSGILADSVPADELKETELKLNTLLEALENA